MAKLIIEGELSQLLKIQKAQRLLEARKIVKCTLEENKDQESESSPVSEALPKFAVALEKAYGIESEKVNDEFDELAKILEDKEVNEVKQLEVNKPEKQEKVKAVKVLKNKAGRPARK